MVHRFNHPCFARQYRALQALGSLLVLAAVALPAPETSAEVLRAPGWLAVLPEGGQPQVPDVRAKGREWFVDSNRGDDAGAGSKTSPWKSLGRLARAGLASGDVVRLRCGSVWRETLAIDARVTSGGLTIASEAGCPAAKLPSIRGSEVVDAGWQADPGQPTASVVDRFGAVSAVFVRGQRLMPARMPNFSGIGQEFAQADGQNSLRSFRLKDKERRLVGDRDLVGATVYVRAVPWQIEKATVSRYDPASGVVTLDKDLTSTVLTGAGYIFEGKRWMLDSPGEWFHDNRGKRLYILTSDGQRPRAGEVEVAARESALVVRNAKQVRLVGLDLRHTSHAALDVQDSKDLVLEGLNIEDPGEYGVLIYRSEGVSLRGARVSGAGLSGVLTREAPRGVISGNAIVDTGLLGRAGGANGAIVVNGEGSLVDGNLVMRSANPGIHFFNKDGTKVQRNVVVRPCLRMADCGGIYTWTAHSPAQATRQRIQRATVKDNIVLGGAGNLEGTAGRGRNQSVGIYLDEMTGGVQVLDNLLAGMENGIYLHNAQFNNIQGNTIRAVSHASVTAHMSLPDADVIRGNRIRGNSLVSRPASRGGDEVFAFKWQQQADPSRLFAGEDANQIQDNAVVRVGADGATRWYVGEGLTARTWSPDDWKRFAGGDRERVLKLAPEAATVSKTDAVNLIADGGFRAKPPGWSPYFNPAGSGGGMAITSCDGTPCLRFTPGHASDVLSSKSFQLESEPARNQYVLRYTVKAGPAGGRIRATVRRNGPPYDTFGLDQTPLRLAPGQVWRAELPFDANSSDPARLDFSAEPGGEYFLSAVSVVRVDSAPGAQVTNARSLLLVNLSDQVQSLSCQDVRLSSCAAIDEQGQEVKWPLAVAPGQHVCVFPRQSPQ